MSKEDRDEVTLKKGTVLQNRYIIEEKIGRGGFGTTYRARDIRVDVPVAVKEYLPRRRMNEKDAERETKMAAKFYGLEGIAAARDFFVEGEHAYIIMEYVNGMNVKQYIQKHGRMSGRETLQRMRPIIRTLGKIHAEGVIHRDISADNLMITEDENLKLIDFGTARFSDGYTRNPHTLILKHGFAPVEQCRSKGRQGPWTDIYALCATMYFMITGMVPDDSVERMFDDKLKSLQQIHGTGLSRHQTECIMKGLEVLPEQRYQSIAELYEDLYRETGTEETEREKERTLRYFTTGFRTTTFLQEIKAMGERGRKRIRAGAAKRILVSAALIMAIAGSALGIFLFYGGSGAQDMAGSVPSQTPSQVQERPEENASGAAVVQAEEIPLGQQTHLPQETHLPRETSLPQTEEAPYIIRDYTGLTRKQVKAKTAALKEAGLKIRYEVKYSKKEKGTVISQTPEAGTECSDLKTVSLVLVVSKGKKPSPTAVPTRAPKPVRTKAPKSAPTKKPAKKDDSKVQFSGDLDQIP